MRQYEYIINIEFCQRTLVLKSPILQNKNKNNNMAVNVRNILNILLKKYAEIEETVVTQEEIDIANSIADILLAYCDGYIEEDESLEFESGKNQVFSKEINSYTIANQSETKFCYCIRRKLTDCIYIRVSF